MCDTLDIAENATKRAYLAGPMRGIAKFNFPAFQAAAEHLRFIGWNVFSPAERDLEDGFDPEKDAAKSLAYYMSIDLPEVCKSQAVICLPGWQSSVGACIEVFTALSCGIQVLDYESLEDEGSLFIKPIKAWPPFWAFWNAQEVMVEGAKKHPKDSWIEEDPNNHALKASRHGLTYTLIKDGHSQPDGENHARMLACRGAFLVAQQKNGNTR